MAGAGKGAVFMAMVGNAILTVLKFVAFAVSGSGAMMSEAIHSLADTANQGLLFVGTKKSVRPADERFHYGYGADRYIFSLVSAMGIFILGCGVTVYHGIHSLMHPPDLSLSWITFAVLGVSLLVDGYVFLKAIAEVNERRGKLGFFAFVAHSTDPTLLAVLFEDGVATFGILIATAGIVLANVTGNPAYDAASSIAIGATLGAMAIWLGWRNRQLILGPAIPVDMQQDVLAFLEAEPSVDAVRSFRTRIVAADRFRIAAEIDYNGRYLGDAHVEWLKAEGAKASSDEDWKRIAEEFGERIVTELGDEVDRIEAKLGEQFPEIRHIDMEAD